LIAVDPTAGVDKRATPVARDRALSDGEIALFWNGCDGLGWPFRDLFRLLLVTGQRRAEVAGMRWRELAIEKREWLIPRERTKNDKAHIVHLGASALQIIAGLPRFNEAGAELPFLFSTSWVRPPSGFSHAKARLDLLMAKANGDVLVADWTLHDLRRTATSGMARLGVQPHVADRVLNHTAGEISGVRCVYNRYEYLAESGDALDLWGQHVERLVAPAQVIALAAAR